MKKILLMLGIFSILILAGCQQSNQTAWKNLDSNFQHYYCADSYQSCNQGMRDRVGFNEVTNCHIQVGSSECLCESLTKSDGNPTGYEWCSFYN